VAKPRPRRCWRPGKGRREPSPPRRPGRFDAYAAAALDATSLETARSHLAELYDQHLITEPAPGRYQLHDLLREHARSLAAGDDRADTNAATRRLLDYYLHTALAADQHVATWAAAYHRPPTGAIGSPSAQRIQETLRQYVLKPASPPSNQ